MKPSKFNDFAGESETTFSLLKEEITNVEDEFDEDFRLTSFCRDLYQAYLKDTGKDGLLRILRNSISITCLKISKQPDINSFCIHFWRVLYIHFQL